MTHSAIPRLLGCTLVLAFGAAHADLPTETFSGATASNAGMSSGVIAGTALEVTAGVAYIAPDSVSGHGNFLDLASGWYSPNFGYGTTEMGSSTVRSVAAFDLLAGYSYTLSFDWSRQAFSAGNGPFESHLTGSLGSHSVTYDEVVGFYYGLDWHSGGVSWTQATDELGAHVTFTAFGLAGYSGMAVDNISMVGLPPAVTAPVPEPGTSALLAGGLALIGAIARRRRQRR
jgi:hypothetical protein